MRLTIVAAAMVVLPSFAGAAPTWQNVSSEQGRRIELDRTSIKREDGSKVLATGRILLDKDLSDSRTGGPYRIIEATTRYDCTSRNAATVRRVFKKNETEVLREEELKGTELPVRSGTLDDKVLREVCRPGKGDAKELAEKAGEAAGRLKQANEMLIKAEASKAVGAASLVKAAERQQGVMLAKLDPPAALPAVVEPSPPVVRTKRAGRGKETFQPAEAALQHAEIHWAYEGEGGPENWHRINARNSLCASGQRQSPIDIRDGIKVDLEPIRFDYRPSRFRIIDNGHTVQVTPSEGGSITVTGKTYELVQFHFHKPSEERIDGRSFDMVVHLVHKSDDGKLAVVAVLLEKGPENPLVQTLWNNLPLERNSEVFSPSAVIDLNTLLPGKRNYYTYMGSLTTPPCTEGVLWLVMREPMPLSQEQIAIFSRLYKHNARPVQAASGRLIKEGR